MARLSVYPGLNPANGELVLSAADLGSEKDFELSLDLIETPSTCRPIVLAGYATD